MGFIPYDVHVLKSVKRQKMVLERYPNCPAGLSFKELADRLLQMPRQVDSNHGNVKFFWQQLLQKKGKD